VADDACPAGCGRQKRIGDLLYRRCWYVLPEILKQEYRAAREALNASRSRSAINAVKAAKRNILESVTPHREH